jgi:hypothetical protein
MLAFTVDDKSSESITLVQTYKMRTTMLSDDDGINGDINRQAKKLIQRAAQEKAHAAQEKKKGADLVTKAERTCKIAEASRSLLTRTIVKNKFRSHDCHNSFIN